jgi:hypothetical protein
LHNRRHGKDKHSLPQPFNKLGSDADQRATCRVPFAVANRSPRIGCGLFFAGGLNTAFADSSSASCSMHPNGANQQLSYRRDRFFCTGGRGVLHAHDLGPLDSGAKVSARLGQILGCSPKH